VYPFRYALPAIAVGIRNLRIEGHVKGKLAVHGDDVRIEPGAIVDGEVKAASVTVAPGAHMREMVEFGWAPE
jgi:cytoskeletal protein CcmA (bactofilin family)